jgi:hypothetical protein
MQQNSSATVVHHTTKHRSSKLGTIDGQSQPLSHSTSNALQEVPMRSYEQNVNTGNIMIQNNIE